MLLDQFVVLTYRSQISPKWIQRNTNWNHLVKQNLDFQEYKVGQDFGFPKKILLVEHIGEANWVEPVGETNSNLNGSHMDIPKDSPKVPDAASDSILNKGAATNFSR